MANAKVCDSCGEVADEQEAHGAWITVKDHRLITSGEWHSRDGVFDFCSWDCLASFEPRAEALRDAIEAETGDAAE